MDEGVNQPTYAVVAMGVRMQSPNSLSNTHGCIHMWDEIPAAPHPMFPIVARTHGLERGSRGACVE